MNLSICKCTWLDTLCAFSLTVPRASSQSNTVQKQPPHFFGNREEVFYYNCAFTAIPSPWISDNRVVSSQTVQLARIHRARLFVLKPQEKNWWRQLTTSGWAFERALPLWTNRVHENAFNENTQIRVQKEMTTEFERLSLSSSRLSRVKSGSRTRRISTLCRCSVHLLLPIILLTKLTFNTLNFSGVDVRLVWKGCQEWSLKPIIPVATRRVEVLKLAEYRKEM